MIKYGQSGFTLLEVLMAVSITALIGIGASQLLSSTAGTKKATDVRAEQLKGIQRMDFWLKRDLWQVAGRKTRDQYGDHALEVTTQSDYDIEFTHSGWAALPFGELKRSNLQRVAYASRSHSSDDCKDALKPNDEDQDGRCLVRYYWPVLDASANSEPIAQIVLNDVKEAQFYFRGVLVDRADPSKNVVVDDWQEDWPGPYASNGLMPDLVHIKLTIETKQLGEIDRWYEVPRFAYIQ